MEKKALQIIADAEKDLRWLDKNINTLKSKYDEKFIAIKNQQVIAVGTHMEDVITVLNLQNIDPSETLIYFISKVAVVL